MRELNGQLIKVATLSEIRKNQTGQGTDEFYLIRVYVNEPLPSIQLS